MKIVSVDRYWQTPAATEKHAFERVKLFHDDSYRNVVYLAFPWATLFDLHDRNRGAVYEKLKSSLQQLKADVSNYSRVVTVCQHIRLERHKAFLIEAGVTDVFWSHCERGAKIRHLTVYPFPLYPVMQSQAKEVSERKYLASFLGAKANQYYMTPTRNALASVFESVSDVFIELKESWHFNDAVYKSQIQQEHFEVIPVSSDERYKNYLNDSVFALCPSGTGPNSIRLWEAIHAGVIPVVLADSYLPPGNIDLWYEACVFCNESELNRLPETLAELQSNPELLAAKLAALKQIKFLYGNENFVADIIELEQTINESKVAHSPLIKAGSMAVKGNTKAQSLLTLSRKSYALLGNEISSLEYLDVVIKLTQDSGRPVRES